MDGAAPKKNFMLIASGAVIGLLYGASIRFGSRMFPNSSVFPVVSLGFVVFLPLAMGFVSVFIVERRRPQPLWIWFLLPWIPLLAGEAAAMIVAWEGLICIVMFTPIGMVASSLGGVAAGLVARYAMSQRAKNVSVVCVLFLPLLVNPLEQRFHAHGEFRRIETVIDIHASPDVVWRNIERVRRINPAELRPSWSRRIGFPNPVEATLSYEGVGGVRHASFDGGVLFIETIDLWQPQRRLAFSIRAQTGNGGRGFFRRLARRVYAGAATERNDPFAPRKSASSLDGLQLVCASVDRCDHGGSSKHNLTGGEKPLRICRGSRIPGRYFSYDCALKITVICFCTATGLPFSREGR